MLQFKIIKLIVGHILLSVILAKPSSNSKISVIGDVKIEVTDDKWQCDKLLCPVNTYRCFVAKEKDTKDPTILKRTNICYSEHNQALLKSVFLEATDADSKIKFQINSYRNGVISSVNSYTSNTKQKSYHKEWNFDLSKIYQEQMSGINKDLNTQVANMNDELSKMKDDLSEMYENLLRI